MLATTETERDNTGRVRGPKEIGDGVWLVGGEEPHQYNCLTYVVETEEACLIFDPGAPEGWKTVLKNLLKWKNKPWIVCLTHAHRDHALAIDCLPAKVKVFAGRKTGQILADGNEYLTAAHIYGRSGRARRLVMPINNGSIRLGGRN
jgi:glyoxylase-like metal-dependent hydrolase (beta-lactamase superfamily II)